MISIFFELPYQRQLKKLYTTKFTDIIDELVQQCETNGGTAFNQNNQYYFCFSTHTLAFEFSSVRFLNLINNLLQQNLNYIESFYCIIDSVPDNFSQSEIEDHFYRAKSLLLPENTFYVTERIAESLSDYVKLDEQQKNMYRITDFTLFNTIKISGNAAETPEAIVLHKNDTFFWSVYNFMLQHPIAEDTLKILSEDELFSYRQVINCSGYFRRHRFEKDLPEYFVDAFFLLASIYFKLYLYQHNGKAPIIYSGDLRNEALNNEIEKILNIIPTAEVKELSKKLPEISKIHDDMLSLIFLTTIFSNYLFDDEFSQFFMSMNKSSQFFTDVYAYLYKYNVIFEQNNLYAHSTHLADFIESKLGTKIQNLYPLLSEFILEKYRQGEIAPSAELISVLESLSYKKIDDIVLAVVLGSNQNSLDNKTRDLFHQQGFAAGLGYYDDAEKAFEVFDYETVLHKIKQAMSEFKYGHSLVGEYKSLFFLSRLSLRQFQINDAINYFTYTLELATKIGNAGFSSEVLLNLSVANFLKNDLSSALNNLDKLDETIEANFLLDWKVKSLFMRGRILFQMGDYKLAEKNFSAAMNLSQQYFGESFPVCQAWYARAISFLGRESEAKKILKANCDKTIDAPLFYLELLFTEPILHDETAEIFERTVSPDDIDHITDFTHTMLADDEKILSGFTFIEDETKDSNDKMLTADSLLKIFFLYYRCKVLQLNLLHSTNSATVTKILQRMIALSNAATAEKNIYSHWYFYFCYDVSSKINGENSPESISYLSKSFKLLQSKVIPTTENKVRDKFMNDNFWNNKILIAAKQQKLL